MNNYKYKEQSGRSMIEMLGVLAIIGVLSVGGIAGYSKAMNKFKTNKVADNVSMIVTNIRTLYAQQKTYTGLDTESAISMGVVPDELVNSDKKTLTNAFNKSVYIKVATATGLDATTGTDKAFYVIFNGLSKEACVSLATNDWGSGYSSGLLGIKVSGSELSDADEANIASPCTTSVASGSAIACPGDTTNPTPLNVANAATACNCSTTGASDCAIMWKFY